MHRSIYISILSFKDLFLYFHGNNHFICKRGYLPSLLLGLTLTMVLLIVQENGKLRMINSVSHINHPNLSDSKSLAMV